jgi:predicted ATP-grasp superfamily ATP-dependent carboligase
MVCAFEGWNDGGEAATVAARYLIERWSATPVGRLDPEEFYDFQVNRPTVHLVEGVTRVIEWPAPALSAASPAGRDVLFLVAPEPNNRWRAFTEAVIDAAKDLGATLLVTLGGFLSDVPYTRDVPVVGSARTSAEADRMGLSTSRYQGPTGIVGVLHDAANHADLPSVSLWAAVPHYLPAAPNPKAALALVQRATELLGVTVDTRALVRAVDRWERGIARLMEESEELAEYVARLESAAAASLREQDEGTDDDRPLAGDGPIPSGESIAAELERFLKDQSSEGGGGPEPEAPST